MKQLLLSLVMLLSLSTIYCQQSLSKISETAKGGYYVEEGYPIPFSPVTSLIFSLPDTSVVDIEILRLGDGGDTKINRAPKSISVILKEKLPGGTYQIGWNFKDMGGRNAPPGLYQYVVRMKRAANGSETIIEAKGKRIVIGP